MILSYQPKTLQLKHKILAFKLMKELILTKQKQIMIISMIAFSKMSQMIMKRKNLV